jgi:hypothetical protein
MSPNSGKSPGHIVIEKLEPEKGQFRCFWKAFLVALRQALSGLAV